MPPPHVLLQVSFARLSTPFSEVRLRVVVADYSSVAPRAISYYSKLLVPAESAAVHADRAALVRVYVGVVVGHGRETATGGAAAGRGAAFATEAAG